MRDLRDLSKEELTEAVGAAGGKPFVAKQIYHWLYKQCVTDFEAMNNVPKAVREALAVDFHLNALTESEVALSTDGTTKYLFRLHDGKEVETVMIPAQRIDHAPRNTVCVSTQVGCAMGCTFCRTGTMGLIRQLTPGEILAQVVVVRNALRAENRELNNIVLMGMGEPLHNYKNTVQALKVMNDDLGLKFGKRKITVSTVGYVPAIRKFAEEDVGVKLALSLHATTDEVRQTLIPVAKKYPLNEVLDACYDYVGRQNSKNDKVTFEYLMLREVNDTMEDAKRLVKICSRIPAKVNLIPLNEYPGCPWTRPEDERIYAFADYLTNHGVRSNIRNSRGDDILAACGQLATEKKAAVSSPA